MKILEIFEEWVLEKCLMVTLEQLQTQKVILTHSQSTLQKI